MILQGIFNILELYSKQQDFFYNNIDNYFREKINQSFGNILMENNKSLMQQKLEEIILFLVRELEELGVDKEDIDYRFSDHFLKIREGEELCINCGLDIYLVKIAPILYEIFLEKIVDYLVNIKTGTIIMNLKAKGFLPIEFSLELKNLKSLFENDKEKSEKLRRYIQIQDKIVHKFIDSEKDIEKLEDLKNPRDKIQVIYLIYRIIDFFHLQNKFDFTSIINYIRDNMDEWLDTVPLVSLKNPDLYHCGLYLADKLKIKIDKSKAMQFLEKLYEENIDEFEFPFLEATDRIYYYLKSTEMVKYWLPQEKLNEILKVDLKFFNSPNLSNLETSQLVVMLKIYKHLNILNKIEPQIITSILGEIEKRISSEGIKQYPDGFLSSEATYYVIFCYYMLDSLKKLNKFELLDGIVSRIYRNLELLNFSKEMNFDLISEIFYACESLKLFNCIETKEMIVHLANYLFPEEVVNIVERSEDLGKSEVRFRHLKVNRTTGEIIY